MKKFTIGAALLTMMFNGVYAQSLKSPDGKFEMNFQLKNGVPFYNLKYNGNVVVEDSKLGLRLFKDSSIKFASEIAKPEDAVLILITDLQRRLKKEILKTKPGNHSWRKKKLYQQLQ
jgi:hypothetical protein